MVTRTQLVNWALKEDLCFTSDNNHWHSKPLGCFTFKWSVFACESDTFCSRWPMTVYTTPILMQPGQCIMKECTQWHGPALPKRRVNRVSGNRVSDKNFGHQRRALFTKSKLRPTCGSEHLQLDQTGWSGWILLPTWSLVAVRKRRVVTTHISVCLPRTSGCSQMPKTTASKL